MLSNVLKWLKSMSSRPLLPSSVLDNWEILREAEAYHLEESLKHARLGCAWQSRLHRLKAYKIAEVMYELS